MGGSTTNIGNWGGMYAPMETLYNTNQANHGAWYQTYVEETEKWREFQQERQQEWLDINYGEDGNRYSDNPDSGGGVYGDARRSEEKWRKIQLTIAALQQAASLYFADKQYKAAKEAQDHQISVWETEKEWAKRYQDTWYNKYLPVELKLLNKIKSRLNDPDYAKPRYDVAQSRAVVAVRSEFARVREQVRKCYDPRCVGMACHTLKSLAIEEAKAATGAMEKGYRAEEARADVKRAEVEESAFGLAKLGRGLADSSLSALNSAAQAAQIAATYKPYSGYASAAGNISGYWLDYSARRTGQFGSKSNMIESQAQSYVMTQGSLSKPSDMLISGGAQVPVTGNTGVPTGSVYRGDTNFDFKMNSDGTYESSNFVVDGGLG